MKDWKIFRGDGKIHDELRNLPAPPPWRFNRPAAPIGQAIKEDLYQDPRAEAFRPSEAMIQAVNAALYLRRPLLLTGKPGTGKSTLITKVAQELQLGPILRWPINSRSTVRSGIYEYDAVGRLHAGGSVENYVVLGPLGTALMAVRRPRALLVDEIDKSDLDFANDLLNVIEEGEYEVAELRRLAEREVTVRDALGQQLTVRDGRLGGGHFPFVVMTSNSEREFPAAFLRRCVRVTIAQPDQGQLEEIVNAQFQKYFNATQRKDVTDIISYFLHKREEGDVSTDQLLNTIFMTIALREDASLSYTQGDLEKLKTTLLSHLGETYI
ncbi:AAA family ATPase [Candidatus Phyllobacterium onerii]|uniref:AAA family ATPase n=1 Tax=Candidatus Phyllobacterium onerii TaxID=3020828 RepID=UPI00232EB5D9|nr:MoxR family ATPase [Phyllobacterium sp. IY22]